MASIAGLRGTGDWGTDERPKNFRESILWLRPNGMAPLTALMSRMKNESVDDPEFSWWEEKLQSMRFQLSASITTSTTTSIAVTGAGIGDARSLKAGDLLLVEHSSNDPYADANEIVIVSSDPSTSTAITVTRGGVGTTATTAIANSTFLLRIGSIYAEGTASPEATTRNPTKLYNYVQIFKDTYEITNTGKKTRTRTGDPIANDKKRKMFDHSVAMEWAFLLGRRHETTGANGKPMRATGGLRSFLSTNVKVFTTTPTITTFMDAVYPVFNYNATDAGDERIVLCGNGALNSLNRLVAADTNSEFQWGDTLKVYGMNLTKFVMPQGTLYLKSHPLLNNHSLLTNSMFVIDPSNIRYRYLRDTAFKDNVQANDEDSTKGQWLTEAGIEVHHEETMAYIGNFVV